MGTTSGGADEKWWLRKPMEASGILRVEGARPRIWRPPAAWILSLLGLAVFLGIGSAAHHRSVEARLGILMAEDAGAPFQIKRIREELAEQEMDKKTLSRELDARLAYARAQKAHEFYLVLDTTRRRFAFKYGDRVVRDGCFDIGAPQTIRDGSAAWNFTPVTGAFSVQKKLEEPDWPAPVWVFAMNRETPPRPLPVVPGGLGRYVLVFSGTYVIHTPPPPESPLKTAKPGSFMISEDDLAAIWKRIGPGTRLYIF